MNDKRNIRLLIRSYTLVIVAMLWLVNAQATHIVGGELTYECLGNDQYLISLTVFRNCDALSEAPFDDPAHIGFFDSNNNLVGSVANQGVLSMSFTGAIAVDPTLFDSCLVVPPSVCVERTTYQDVVTLPTIPGGYQVIYQRCCRNANILNMPQPSDEVGSTYACLITEQALQECNSSAVFNEWPPTYICVGTPIEFDHSAIDAEGDSLVYSLCNVYDGAEVGDPNSCDFGPCFSPTQPCGPAPCPPFNPPLDEIAYQPPYSLADIMGGVPLSIDSETGLLTGTPNTIGKFVVGVCVEEYRNGVLISTTKRDFQYNVGQCGETISAFFAPQVDCDGFTVNFENQSQDANAYLWDFGDPSTTSDVSTAESPTYLYPDTGLYEIQLIAGPNQVCADTSYSTVSVQIPSLFVDFDLDIQDSCTYPAQVSFTDLSFDTLSTIVDWDWAFSNGDTSDQQNPIWYVTEDGSYQATLTATAANGCQVSHTDMISIDVLELGLEDSIGICVGDFTPLNPNTDPALLYNWSPNTHINNTNAPNPIVTPPVSTTYYVTVTDPADGCEYEDSVYVEVIDLVVDFDDVVPYCPGDTVALHDGDEPHLDYAWTPSENLTDPFSGTTGAFPANGEEVTYNVFVLDTETGCTYQDQVTVSPIITPVEDVSFFICPNESIALNDNFIDTLVYTWTPATGLDDPNADNPIASPEQTTVYNAEILSPATGCTQTQEVTVTVDEVFVDNESTFACVNAPTALNPGADTSFEYLWSPGTYLDDVQSPNPTILASGGGSITYYVTITNPATQCNNIDSIEVFIEELIVDIDDVVNFCPGDTLSLHDGTEPNLSYSWTPNTNIIDPQSGTASAFPMEETTYYVTVLDNVTGCVYEDSVRCVPIIEVPEDVTLFICPNDSIALNPNADFNLTHEWLPNQNIDNPILANPTVFPDVTTNYTATITDPVTGCSLEKDVLVEVDPLFLATTDWQVCLGTSQPLHPTANTSYDYSWQPTLFLDNPTAPNPAFTTTDSTGDFVYVVEITNPATQCVNEDSLTIFVPEGIGLTVSDDTVVCVPSVTISASSATATSYEWHYTPTLDSLLSTDTIIEVFPGLDSVYYIRAEDNLGCEEIDSVRLGSQAIDVDVPPQFTVCERNEFVIEAINNKPTDDLQFSWSPQDSVVVAGQGTATPTVVLASDFIIEVEVVNQYGCEDFFMIPIDVIPNTLDISATATPDSIYPGESSQLEVTQSISTTYDYFWSQGIYLNNDTIYNPVATPPVSTPFDVVAEDVVGCKDTAQVWVYLKDFLCADPYIFIPNAFTPNGDGMNDIFQVRGNAVDEVYMAVYDRWGEKVFETNSLDVGWDGTYKGKELPPDVYGYYLQVRCLNEEEYFKKGNVSLLR